MKPLVNFSDLVGETIQSIHGDAGDDSVVMTLASGHVVTLEHDQDCCETVEVNDIDGDLQSLVGLPLVQAEEVTHENENPPGVTPPEYQDSFTWTFYKLATINGHITIRFHGDSNGYYSERVSMHVSEP